MKHRQLVSNSLAETFGRSSRLRDFRPDIEGLRFVLILMVVLHHIDVPLLGGVDGSIALSGALGVTVIMRELIRKGSFRFGRFYARRARRLLPLATLVIVGTLIASAVWLPVQRLQSLVWDAASSATFWINFRLAASDVNYREESGETSVLQHFWSLAVEEQFWLLLPIFLVGMIWLIRRFNLRVWPLIAALVLLTAGSLTLSVILTQQAQPWAYFGTPTRIWEFGLGALTAVGAQLFSRMWRPLAAMVTWAGLGMLIVGSYFNAHNPAVPGWVMIWPVLGVCMIIAGGSAAPKYGTELVLGLRPVRFLGRMSYGWYLWHWPALLIAPYALGYTRGNLAYEVPIAAITLVVAVGTYYAVERPAKSWAVLTEKPKIGLAWAARFAGVSVAAAALLWTSVTVQASAAPTTVNYIKPDQITQLVAAAQKTTLLSDVAKARSIGIAEGQFGRCLNTIQSTKAQPCFLGDSAGDRTMVLLGSSLAHQWVPALDKIATQVGMRLVVFAKGSCPAQPYSVDTESYMIKKGLKKGVYTQCDDWRKDAYEQIAALEPQLVILSSRMEQESTPEAIDSGVRFFKDRGIDVVLLGETPGFERDRNMPDCMSRNSDKLQECMLPLTDLVDVKKMDAAADAARKAGATVVDPLPWLCTTVCPPVINDQPVYRDDRHMSVDYVLGLTEVLKSQLPLDKK